MIEQVDTLTVSDEQLQQLLSQDDYLGAYEGTYGPSLSLLDRLWRAIDELISGFVRGTTGGGMNDFWLVIGVILLLALIVVAIIKRKTIMRWFHRDAPIEYEVHDDDIYGIDFDSDIAAARAAGNHAQLVRLYYLKTLRALVDAGRLEWVPGRTPSQYAMLAGITPMTDLTNLFLRVRYGKFDAGEEQVATAVRCCDDICAGLDVAGKGGERP